MHGLPKLEPSRNVSSKVHGATSTCKNRGSMDPVHILMDPVHGGGPCFVLSHQQHPGAIGCKILFPESYIVNHGLTFIFSLIPESSRNRNFMTSK